MTQVVAGIVGPARGLKGEMIVRPTTDSPDERFAPGARLVLADGRELEVADARVISNRLCLTLVGVSGREAAEALRGEKLLVDAEPGDDESGYYASDLTGLAAVDTQGKALGTVTGMLQGPAQDLITVQTPSGEVMVPFVEELVPEVDLVGGRVVVDPPEGLFPDQEA